jgi:tetratricopeptide (TPR) repeat protein
MWLWRQLRQNKSVDLVKITKTLRHLGVPARVYLEEVADSLPAYDPAWVLEHFCSRSGGRDPFLASLADRFRRLLEEPLTPGACSLRRHREIEALEEKALFDRHAAKAELEVLGRDLLVSAEAALAGDRGLGRAHLSDCARLLLAWGAVQRFASLREDAAGALSLAYRFGLAARDTAILGLFFSEGAQLLSDLGQPGHALRFAQAAGRHFQMLRKSGLASAAMVQLSQAFAQLGQHREARTHAIGALRLSSRGRSKTRAITWAQLASLARVRGKLRRAIGLFERAKANAGANSYLKAFVHGRQALLLAQVDRRRAAAQAFRSASRIFEKRGETLEILCLAVDLAEALISKGRRSETLDLVRAVTPRFEQWGHDTPGPAPVLWLDLCALILDGRRDRLRQQVLLVREALARASGPRLAPTGLAGDPAPRSGP